MVGEVVTFGSPLGGVPAAPQRVDGIRVVTRENGRYCDLMPSTLSSYLLPTLADFSLVRRETRSPAGSWRLTADAVAYEEIGGGADLSGLRALVGDVTAGLGSIGLVTQISLRALGGFEAGGPLALTTLGPAARMGAVVPEATIAIAQASPVVEPAPAATEESPAIEPLAADAPVSAIASRITALSGLSDELLAALFKVERETFCRWRTGALTNPRVGNRRRLGLLLALLEELQAGQVIIKDWLLNGAVSDGLTPYELLERGRIDEVAYAAAAIGQPLAGRDSPGWGGGRAAVR